MLTKKVRRRKFNFIKFFKFLLFLIVLIITIILLSKIKIKSIKIIGNSFLTDEEIIETAKLENYPSYLKTTSYRIKKNLLKNKLIEGVEINKKWGFVIEIDITEIKPLFLIRSANELVLSKNKKMEEIKLNKSIPILINYVPEKILNKLAEKFESINNDVLTKISEIEYSPTTYDNERFLLYMIDGNEVYITLNKTQELDKYNKIKKQLGIKKGILYLDSGNYFEIKE